MLPNNSDAQVGDEYWNGREWKKIRTMFGCPIPEGVMARRPTLRATDAEDSAASQAVSNADNLYNSDGYAVPTRRS